MTSFPSALAGTIGQIVAPFFLAFGLVKGAFTGTEPLAAVLMHVTKLVAYGTGSALSPQAVKIGLLLGSLRVLGSYLGKRFIDQVSEELFRRLVDVTLVVVGLALLILG